MWGLIGEITKASKSFRKIGPPAAGHDGPEVLGVVGAGAVDAVVRQLRREETGGHLLEVRLVVSVAGSLVEGYAHRDDYISSLAGRGSPVAALGVAALLGSSDADPAATEADPRSDGQQDDDSDLHLVPSNRPQIAHRLLQAHEGHPQGLHLRRRQRR